MWYFRLRIVGSSALDMCRVAHGKVDAYMQHGALHCWDMAAGDLMVREAGGVVMDTKGRSLLPWRDSCHSYPA